MPYFDTDSFRHGPSESNMESKHNFVTRMGVANSTLLSNDKEKNSILLDHWN